MPSPDDRTPLTCLTASHAPPRLPCLTPPPPVSLSSQVTRLLKEKFKSEFKADHFRENGKLKRHTRLAEKCFFRADDPCAAPPAPAQSLASLDTLAADGGLDEAAQ